VNPQHPGSPLQPAYASTSALPRRVTRPAGVRRQAAPIARKGLGRFGAQWALVYALWIVAILYPQWVLADFGLRAALKLPLVLTGVVALTVAMKPTKADWMLGMAAWIAITALNLPFSPNPGYALVPLKELIWYYALGLCLLRIVRTPQAAAPMLSVLCVGQYFWWAAWGLKSGGVSWHPDFANYDAFGPLMAVGVGPAYFYAGATTDRKKRIWSLIAAMLCVLGVISSFARGAVLSLIMTVGYIWYRSPRRGRTAGYIAAACLIAGIAASIINGKTRGSDTQSSFWDEMGTMFDTSEGSTGSDREVLWGAAVKVYKQYPILGAGAANFGVAAAEIIQPGEIAGAYGDNPQTLYDRALHNIYFQILSEYGTAGILAFLYLLWRFYRNTRAMLKPGAAEAWRRAGGTQDVRAIALGLESGMVAFLGTSFFYNQLFYVTFYSLLFANALVYSILQLSAAPVPGRPAQPRFRTGLAMARRR
jgi:O-antigen ligase